MSKELIKNVAETTGFTQVATKDILDAILEEIKTSLQEGEDVTFYGFGKFTVTERAERMGRNPATGKAIKIAAKKIVKFKPASGLKNHINE